MVFFNTVVYFFILKEVRKVRIVATKNRKRKKKFPWRIALDNGRQIPVPSQYNFKSSFIRTHGCSLVAFYMALRYKGIKKNMQQVLQVCPKEIEMRRKVSAHRNCEGNQYDLPREAGILSQVFDDRTIKGKIKERLYDPV